MTIASGLPESILPPVATKQMQNWIESGHLIYSGDFFVFESSRYSKIELFAECISCLGGIFISVEPIKKISLNNNRKRGILYRAMASLQEVDRDLKQYWLEYGSVYSRFDERAEIESSDREIKNRL
jgi:phycoerythrin-associated linker protein